MGLKRREQNLAAARSRSGSDMPPACHSLPSRRFATPALRIHVEYNEQDGNFPN